MRRKKDNLIPFEKNKRIIRLDKRGQKRGITAGTVIFMILGILFLCYCAAILFCGFGTWFFLIWGAMGALCIGISLVLGKKDWMQKIPSWLKRTVAALIGVGVLLFCIVEGLIFSGFDASAKPGADYVIVLGAQWRTNGPSEVLRRRLEKAITYLNENPDTMVIVSGGQGANESVSEAVGMKEFLINAGIEENRIMTEENSFNTMENLAYSAQLLDKENDRVVLVTNNFHMYRAIKIAEKQGYSRVEGLAASSVVGFLPNNLLREFMSILKNFAVGNL